MQNLWGIISAVEKDSESSILKTIKFCLKEDIFMIKSDRVSESVRLGTLLTVTGGFMDAYSYLVRGSVFANAETGNIVLMGLNLAQGNWGKVLHYLVPVIAFAVGVFVAEWVRKRLGEEAKLHWKEGVLWLEVVLVFLAGLIPQAGNDFVNCMIAFICAMQVEAFRKIHGKAFATTMCTGNLRSGTELLSVGQLEHDNKKKGESMHYYWINFIFIVGAAIGAWVCGRFAEKSIWFCLIPLLGALGFIGYQKRNAEI